MWYQKLEGASRAERGKAMHYNGTLRVTNRQKAEAFIAEYAKNSKLTLGKEDRWVKQKMNETLRSREDENDDVKSDFSLREMKATIASTDPTKAAGPDGIHPRLLRYLGEKCLRSLWLFSRSWNSVEVPQMRRLTNIVPIPKKGTDQSAALSYRPINLTSVLGKVLERMVKTRLNFFLESRSLLTEYQAGFSHNQATEDQPIRLSQTINDVQQTKPLHRTVCTLVDYNRAYDSGNGKSERKVPNPRHKVASHVPKRRKRSQTEGTTQNNCGTRSSLKVNLGPSPQIPRPENKQ